MESVYQDQDEQIFADVELSPQDQLRRQWNQQPGFIRLIKQKNVIDQNAELLQYTDLVWGWLSPMAFAAQGLIVAAIAFFLFNWYSTHDSGKLQDQIVNLQATTQAEVKRQDEIMSATQAEIRRISRSNYLSFHVGISPTALTREEAIQQLNATLDDTRKSEEQYKREMARRERALRAKQSAVTLANSGTPLLFSLALMLAAGLVGKGLQRDFGRNRHARRAGDFYLYCATAEGLLPNLVFLAFLNFALSGGAYGLSSLFDSLGPFFWGLFWIGFYLLVLRYLVIVSRGMYKAMELSVPAKEWDPENRILVRIHNSFWMTFAGLETGFLVLCYLLYLAAKHF